MAGYYLDKSGEMIFGTLPVAVQGEPVLPVSFPEMHTLDGSVDFEGTFGTAAFNAAQQESESKIRRTLKAMHEIWGKW